MCLHVSVLSDTFLKFFHFFPQAKISKSVCNVQVSLGLKRMTIKNAPAYSTCNATPHTQKYKNYCTAGNIGKEQSFAKS